MTNPSDFEQTEAILPGMEPAKRGEAVIVTATRRTLREWHRLGLVDEQHAQLTAMMMVLAESIDAGRAAGRASAVAMAAAQILATWDRIVPTDAEGGGEKRDAFTELAGDLRCAAGLCDHPGHPVTV